MATQNAPLSESDLVPGYVFDVPELHSGNYKQDIGIISVVLRNQLKVTITAVEEVAISPRLKAKVLVLDNQERIIFTLRKKVNIPEGIDGILTITADNQLSWQQHEIIHAFRAKVVASSLKNVSEEIANSWSNIFAFRAEKRNPQGELVNIGLRPPQLGALHAIGSHWSLYENSGTLVMPTGTGKTETMLATLIAFQPGRILIVVPSKALRDQTYRKFSTLGLLRILGNIPMATLNPIVGIITSRPQKPEDLDFFDKCNVVIATMSALNEVGDNKFHKIIASKVDTLFVDEAHHIAAPGWGEFKEAFSDNKIIQFTATPYRRDGKLVDGKILYEYALHQAQEDGYFKKINFYPIHQIDQVTADSEIAQKAVELLKKDRASNLDHILMARCVDTIRAAEIHKIYLNIAPEFNPVLVHSFESGSEESLKKLFNRESRIVVCVNMLGEGFDLPQLKIAAVHDIHKSLAILLQFTGRFTRSSADQIGEASVVANIARAEVSQALERLYSEDADWNILLSEMSSQAARTHAELIKFLNDSQRLDESTDNEDPQEISHHLLKPTFNTMVFECENFQPKRFHEGIPGNISVKRVWINNQSHTLFFVARMENPLKWTSSKNIKDTEWHLYVLHHDPIRNLLFFSTSDKSSSYERLLAAVGSIRPLSGELIFRCLGRINRLIFQNIGVKKHGRRNLRFAMYVGADVVQALTLTEKGGSSKSNLSGTGWENGSPITIGCSFKGRVWARDPGTIPELIQWCENVGDKLLDKSIDVSKIIDNVLIPEEIETLPDITILSIDWPVEILRKSEERIELFDGLRTHPISMIDLQINLRRTSTTELTFTVSYKENEIWESFIMSVGGELGFVVKHLAGATLKIKIGKTERIFSEYLSEYPPLIRFVDLSELDGNLLIRPQNPQELVLPENCLDVWDWSAVDISKETMWKDNTLRTDSIQWRTAQEYINGNYDIVFDDDAPGEAADIVCFKEETEFIRLTLLHCKFTKGTSPGERVVDVVEVSSQAVRSTKWKWKFKDLCLHILGREKRLSNAYRNTRFLKGTASDVNRFSQISRFKEVKLEIIIVQPGISKSKMSNDQKTILASSHSFLKETVEIDLQVICSP